MTNVYPFTGQRKLPTAVNSSVVTAPTAPVKEMKGGGVYQWVYLVVTLLSPLLRWVLYVDVTYQFFRMLYYWDTPGMFAGWVFALHFAMLTGLIFFVAYGAPKKEAR